MFLIATICKMGVMGSGDRLDDERLSWIGLLLEATAGVRSFADRVHAKHGVSGSDFGSMLRIARSPDGELAMTGLALQTGMSTSGLTRVIDRLEDLGLVSRRVCRDDRRVTIVSLTADGRRRLEDDAAQLVHVIDEMFTESVGRDHLEEFLAALHRLRDRTNPQAAGPTRRQRR